jgi:hypothetical protein
MADLKQLWGDIRPKFEEQRRQVQVHRINALGGFSRFDLSEKDKTLTQPWQLTTLLINS